MHGTALRLCNEIIEDLPKTYELNEEATAWVARMMNYTVAGGKMNRGLATLSVRNTFAKLVGHNLSNKVGIALPLQSPFPLQIDQCPLS